MENVSIMPELTDKELIESTLNGNDYSFSQLVNRYQDLIYTLSVRITKNEQIAEEVAQDAFIRAYKSLKSFEHKSKFSTWLYKIAYNLSLNALKKENRSKEIFSDRELPESEKSGMLSGNYQSLLDIADSENISQILAKCIDELPPEYGSVLTLFHLNQLKYEEIAEITGKPIGTVKSYIFRGRYLLRELIINRYEKWELI